MAPLLSCEFNMDTTCVELKFADGSMVSIDWLNENIRNPGRSAASISSLVRMAVAASPQH